MGFKPRLRPVKTIQRTSLGGRPGNISYIVSPVNGQPCVFVPHPDVAGAYMKTNICVALTDCPACGAEKYEPCLGSVRTTHTVGHHVDRAMMAKRLARKAIRQRGFLVCKDSYIVSIKDLVK